MDEIVRVDLLSNAKYYRWVAMRKTVDRLLVSRQDL